MPRNSGRSSGSSFGRSAPRPKPAPAAPVNPQRQQQAPHSSAAHSPAATQKATPPAVQQQSSGPGLFGQMASTAAGVAVGSSIGHAIGGLFSGGSSSPPAEAQQAPPLQAQPMDNSLYQSNAWTNPACETDVRNFRKCMDDNKGDLSICGWYLDQLKACQAAARQY